MQRSQRVAQCVDGAGADRERGAGVVGVGVDVPDGLHDAAIDEQTHQIAPARQLGHPPGLRDASVGDLDVTRHDLAVDHRSRDTQASAAQVSGGRVATPPSAGEIVVASRCRPVLSVESGVLARLYQEHESSL